MTHDLTVKEYAALERVTERTVRNWIAKGAVAIRRTPGGWIRIRPSVAVFTLSERKSSEDSGNPSA